jgi:hypothetical protein
MLIQLHNNSVEIGLTINKGKTKIMTNNTGNLIKVQDTDIQCIKQYVWLRQLLAFKGSFLSFGQKLP